MLLRENQVQPLLLVFEDLHWIDGETQAFLDSLVESLPSARILLAVNYRPEYRHGWGNKTYYASSASTRCRRRAPTSCSAPCSAPTRAPRRSSALLIERTEGSPLFLEESVRTLVETGALVGERGAYRLVQARDTLQVPATVQAIIAARIDRLRPGAQARAPGGRRRRHARSLRSAAGDRGDRRGSAARGLAQLQTAEFVYEAQLFPDLEYTFKHALTHEVAYGSVLQERRRALHAAIVEAIERLYADRLSEHVERLAHHAVRAAVRRQGRALSSRGGVEGGRPFGEPGGRRLIRGERWRSSPSCPRRARR